MFRKKKKAIVSEVLTEAEVLKRLDIPNFRHMSKEKAMSFASMLPYMDSEVAKTALKQFPHFAQITVEVLACYKEVMGEILKTNAMSTQEFNKSCDDIIEALSGLLKTKLGFRKKKFIIEKMMEVLEIKADAKQKNNEWLNDVVKNMRTVAVSIVGIAGMILGIKFIGKK